MIIFSIAFSPSASAAAVLQVDSNGILTGATDVFVNGRAYDVAFRDGSCVSLFNGCDSADDFIFHDGGSAKLASLALIEQVFIGVFNNNPLALSGCFDLVSICMHRTPYAFAHDPNGTLLVTYSFTTNFVDHIDDNDRILEEQLNADEVFSNGWQGNYAVWQAVPEPSVIALLTLPGFALAWSQRRRHLVKRAPT